MKNYTSDDFADPGNPTPEEFSLWLRANPTRGLSVFALEQEDFAKAKTTMNAAERRSEQARLRKKADSIARHMLHFLFDMMETVPGNPRLFKRDPEADPKALHVVFSLLGLARQYLPHVAMPERAQWRSLIRKTDTLCKDMLAKLKSNLTHQPLPPDVSRRFKKYDKVLEDEPRKRPRPRRRNDT